MAMTADEIKEAKEDYRSQVGWIKELCWQVAKLNEQMEVCDFLPRAPVPIEIEQPRQKRKYVRKAKIA